MALNWSWNEKVGEATIRRTNGLEHTLNLYQGNAYLIFIWEYEDDGKQMYTLWDFWADKEHAKIMLGLKQNWEGQKKNNYEGIITKFRLNKDMVHFSDTTRMILKAFDNITIETYTEKGDENE